MTKNDFLVKWKEAAGFDLRFMQKIMLFEEGCSASTRFCDSRKRRIGAYRQFFCQLQITLTGRG